MSTSSSEEAAPVKTIDRAAAILRCLAKGPEEGSRLSDIAAGSGLGKTTTHRLLAALVSVGFVDRGESRLYRLGYRSEERRVGKECRWRWWQARTREEERAK